MGMKDLNGYGRENLHRVIGYWIAGTSPRTCARWWAKVNPSIAASWPQLDSPRRRTSRPIALAPSSSCRLDSLVAQNRFNQNQTKPRLAFIPSTTQLTIDQHYPASLGGTTVVALSSAGLSNGICKI